MTGKPFSSKNHYSVIDSQSWFVMFDYQHPSKYLLLCSLEERKSCRFGTTL